MNYVGVLRERFQSAIKLKEQFLEDTEQLANFQKAVELVISSYKNGGRLYIAGNGGSAADAQHLAAEFVSKLARPRRPLPAEALTVDTSALTAIGNDYGYDEVFSRQIEAKMKKADVFLAITTSGQSKNILRALDQCRLMGIRSILLSGRDGGKAKTQSDCSILTSGNDTNQIQELHIVLYHTLCLCVEEEICFSGRA